ncbi:MAG: DUF3566 domain-containing protein [candidate division Zixibacteria bacterium]|nr:DUF3566 domain-containing protein [candidate division Zixibacteria bacterium]
MNYEIKRIDLWSAIKISFIVNGVLGFGLGLVIGLLAAAATELLAPFMAMGGSELQEVGSGSTAASIIVTPFFVAFFMAVIYGVIVTGIFVVLYNLIAKLSGGVKVSINKNELEAGVITPARSGPSHSYE